MRRIGLAVVVALSLILALLDGAGQPASAMPQIGLLDLAALDARASLWEAFRQGMREFGYVDGRTVIFEPRSADGQRERLPALAAELVQLRVDVIVTAGYSALEAARQATSTIPIVAASGSGAAEGLAGSLARPGGNVTGVTTLTGELIAKRLELAREMAPAASLAMVWDARSTAGPLMLRETEAVAKALGVRLHAAGVRSPAELDTAFSAIARKRPMIVLVPPSPTFFGERRRLAELALTHRLPTVCGQREYAEAGSLIAYGADLAERFRRAATYVDKILKGAKPADLPVEQPTKFELVINLKTAKALGLTIPQSILVRADEIIQ